MKDEGERIESEGKRIENAGERTLSAGGRTENVRGQTKHTEKRRSLGMITEQPLTARHTTRLGLEERLAPEVELAKARGGAG